MGDLTDQSLLRRVKNPTDSKSWREFFKLYNGLLKRYARMKGLSHADAEDVAQECMFNLSKHMRRFDYSRAIGKFRNYLWTLANNAVASNFRRRRPRPAKTGELAKLQESAAQSREVWDRTWLREHLRYCLKLVETRFAPHTIAAFKMYAMEERPIDEVCRKLKLSRNQVHQAKSRVTQRLREEMRKRIGNVL